MNRKQRNQNRATAKALADEVYEANLPLGLRLSGGELRYKCPRCESDRQWYGTPEDFADPDTTKLCGGTQWCLP